MLCLPSTGQCDSRWQHGSQEKCWEDFSVDPSHGDSPEQSGLSPQHRPARSTIMGDLQSMHHKDQKQPGI